MDAEGHSFTHPCSIRTYTLITIMNGVHRRSVTANKMNLWTEHVFGRAHSYSVRQQQAAWRTDKKGLQTKEAITALSLCMSAFQRPLSAAEETKTMPSVLLGNWCVTFIRCLGSVWGEEGSWWCWWWWWWGRWWRGGEGLLPPIQSWRGLNNERVHFLGWNRW